MKVVAALLTMVVVVQAIGGGGRSTKKNWLEVTWEEPDLGSAAGTAATVTERSFVVPGAGWYYYGPQQLELVNKSAVFLTKTELCEEDSNELNKVRRQVAGKIVVFDAGSYKGVSCGLGFNIIFRRMAKRGALALVYLDFSPASGLPTYVHYSYGNRLRWFRTRQMAGMTIPSRYVMPDGSLAKEFFKNNLSPLAHATDAPKREMKLTFHLYDPEADKFARLFKSAYWIVIMQILIPLAGLVVSANAFAQILIERERRQTRNIKGWSVCEIVCVVEAPVMLITAILLASGQYGPNSLPYAIYLFFNHWFSGCNNYTALVLARYMREQTQRRGSTARPDGSFWRRNRGNLRIFAACFLVFPASVGLYIRFQGAMAVGIVVILMVVCGLVQTGVALFFFYRARAYLRPIVTYLAREEQLARQLRLQRRSQTETTFIQRTTHLALWMSRSAAFMILNSTWIVLIAVLTAYPVSCHRRVDRVDELQCSQRATPALILVMATVICLSSTAVSYAQVRSLKRLSDPSTSETLKKFAGAMWKSTRRLCRGRLGWTRPPPTDTASSDSNSIAMEIDMTIPSPKMQHNAISGTDTEVRSTQLSTVHETLPWTADSENSSGVTHAGVVFSTDSVSQHSSATSSSWTWRLVTTLLSSRATRSHSPSPSLSRSHSSTPSSSAGLSRSGQTQSSAPAAEGEGEGEGGAKPNPMMGETCSSGDALEFLSAADSEPTTPTIPGLVS